MKRTITSILFLLLFNLVVKVAHTENTGEGDEFGRKSYALPPTSKEGDDTMIRRIEEEMLRLNKSGDAVRDKRALGILLQGFMEALGYTVAPIQLASLPNPSTAAQMPVGAAAAPPAGMMPAMMSGMMSGMMPAMMPPMMANGSAPAAPRQRETVRITGLLNFGNSENSTNLINHLSQYENIFHGNRSAPASMTTAPSRPMAPAPAIGPDIDPRYAPPLKEPLFVKIPLPIVPNLPPPQPPSPMPLEDNYQNEYYSKDNSEEYSGSKDDSGQSGTYDEEDDDGYHTQEYEVQKEKFEHFLDRNHDNKDADESYEQPKNKEKQVEKECKNNKSVETYNVEDKEIHDPSEVDVEGSNHGSKFNHNTYVDEPNWKEEQDAKVYNLAAEQEARVEALAEENAEREKEKDHGHKEEEEFHRSREKEIDDANEEHEARYEKNYDDGEEEASSEKETYDEGKYHKDDEDEGEEKEEDHEEKGSQRNEARAQAPNNEADQPKNYQDADFYPATLPLSTSHEMPQQNKPLKDSYGKNLEKPGGKVDDRVAEYITMFKNPQTGVYDPERVQEYEHARISFEHGDLIDGFNRIQKEYGSPENKYEEYEIDGERVEHRSNDKDEDESKESLATEEAITECDCKKKKKKVELQGARSSERTVTHPPPPPSPPRTSPQPTVETTGYGPYYSTVKYMYDPLEHDHGIIARLTSYETPTTVRFDDHTGVYDSRYPTTVQFNDHTALRHSPVPSTTLVPPTIPPERFTTMNFLHEAEAKGVQAWPAPFDYLYDNSEHKNVVYKKSPPVASSPAPFKTTKSTRNQHMVPFGEHRDKVKMVFRDHSGEGYRNDRDSTRPRSFQNNRKAKPSEKIDQRAEYYSHLPTTEATIFESRKRPPSSERYSNYRSSTKAPIRSPNLLDVITTRRPSSTKSPRKNRKTVKSLDRTPRPSSTKHRESTIKPTIKVKYTYPFAPDQRTIKAETTNYLEKDGTLVLSEPTPYYFDEGFEEFTEEPNESNTDRIKIKEYRNHVASVKVSELKQLHPEGSMQIFKYTRNL